MALNTCDRCGAPGRADNGLCSACEPASRGIDAAAEPARGETLHFLAYLAGVFLVFDLFFAVSDAQAAQQRLAWAAALVATALAQLVYGWRAKWPMTVAFALGGASAATYGHLDMVVQFIIDWIVTAALPFHFLVWGGPGLLDRRRASQRNSRGDSDLRDEEERTRAKLREIEEQRGQLDRSLALLARERDTPALAEVREKLRHAGTVLQRQSARNTAHLWAIEAVRWQHRLASVVERHNGPSADPDQQMEQLSAVAEEGRLLIETLARDTNTAEIPEGQQCLARIRALLAHADELREALVVGHALRTIQRIDPADHRGSPVPRSREPLESLRDALQAGTSLAASEQEHNRLRADEQEAEDVDRFLRQLESDR